MKKNVLLRTNIFICIVIILGFSLTSLISYHSNNGIFKRDIEHISPLTSEGIFHVYKAYQYLFDNGQRQPIIINIPCERNGAGRG